MARFNHAKSQKSISVVPTIYQAIDIMTSVLILTGQITATGVFTLPEGISVTLTGPIFGASRLVGKTPAGNYVIDAIDVAIAILLIIDQLSVVGPFVGFKSLFIVVTGPSLNVQLREFEKSRKVSEFYTQFRQEILHRYISTV